MRLARIIGTVTLNRKAPQLRPGKYVIAEALDGQALAGHENGASRAAPMPESLIVFDELGAATGQVIAVSEGGEATQPFRPNKVPVDAYNAAIIDRIDLDAGRLPGPQQSNGLNGVNDALR